MKAKLIKAIIDELNSTNESRVYNNLPMIDVCFAVSSLDQHIEEFSVFMEDIANHDFSVGFTEDEDGHYCTGEVKVYLYDIGDMECQRYLDYHYVILLSYDERYWGYCECTADMPGYSEIHKCCGNGCDWVAPRFSINKIEELGGQSWNSSESGYWEYQRIFNESAHNTSEIVEKHKKEQSILCIQRQISELNEKLSELQEDNNETKA